jgi:hypothetical protein
MAERDAPYTLCGEVCWSTTSIGARVERHPRVGGAHVVRDTPSGRSGEAVSLERGFDGARANELGGNEWRQSWPEFNKVTFVAAGSLNTEGIRSILK